MCAKLVYRKLIDEGKYLSEYITYKLESLIKQATFLQHIRQLKVNRAVLI